MAPSAYVAPVVESTLVFRDDIFKGKVLFCTGGGSGICRAMTEAVMRHGASAAIVGRKLDRLTQAAKELSQATGQVCIPAQADTAVTKTIEKFGRIDFVICGAAGNFLAPISGMSENAFRTVMEIDTVSTIAHVRASKGSFIMTSATLHYKGTPYQAHTALSNVLAIEEGPAWSPGPIANTEGMSRLAPTDGKEFPYPLGRPGDVKDVSNATVFLFSEAAAYITGQILAHLRTTQLPYPASVLDPSATLKVLKARM
ncbi:2,4-dienoyl-CoA reductase [Armillaria novae-zelandiae]|uniref:2,4-dienoyl-CoA reductase [(3E)-enoyl-CoA-producing] n=1 Tax=Armillaria novae-zelandiae TaxID=153914 RepID=A0AA39NSA2_9AGAR|nr:2,4-dienoyl-CoA reductase [Armillaria novae-zelandiae]